MKSLFKFTTRIDFGVFVVEMPVGSEILSTQQQGGFFALWALCPKTDEYEPRIIEVCPTGMEFGDQIDRQFLATIQIGVLVFHLFEQNP